MNVEDCEGTGGHVFVVKMVKYVCFMALGVREWTVPFWQEVRKKDAPETLDGQVGTWQY